MARLKSSDFRKIPLLILPILLIGIFCIGSSAKAGIVLVNGTYTSSTTWTSDNTYVVSSSLTLASGTTLTVNSGTVVKFVKDGDLQINGHGVLNVVGAPANPVYFTAITDSTVGSSTSGYTTSTAARGDGGYLYLLSNSSGTLNNAIVEYGGHTSLVLSNIYQTGGNLTLASTTVASSSNYGLYLTGGTATVTSSTFSQNSVYGVYVNGSSANLSLANNFFANNSSSDAFLQMNLASFTASGDQDISVGTSGYRGFSINGVTAANLTLTKDLPYVLGSGSIVTVASGTALTVNHGDIVKFAQDTDILVNPNGVLNVTGTSTDPVYFTALKDDSVGGDTNGDGSSTAARGDGGFLDLGSNSSSTLSNVVIAYGGHYAAPYNADIYQSGGTLNLSNVTVASSSNYGLRTAGGTANVTSSIFSNNTVYGIYEFQSSGKLSLSSSTFVNNSSSAGYIDLGSGINFVPSANNNATGTGYRGFILAGTLTTTTTLQSAGIPYIIQTSVVASDTTLTIASGTIFKFSPGASLVAAANSTLSINPNSDLETGGPVYFTSLTDSSLGGNTNNSSTIAQPGDGGYIQIKSGASSTIELSDFFYGGAASGLSSIYQTGGNLNLSNSAIASSSNYGIYLTGGSSTILGSYFLNNPYGIYMTSGTLNVASSAFEGNTTDGVKNAGTGASSTAMAANNYWNSYTGPTNASNAGGVGDPVSNNVIFQPFINNNGARNHYLTFSCVNASLMTVFCSSVQNSSTLLYLASTTYSTAWNAAVNTWNTASGTMPITITSTTVATSSAYVNVYDVNLSDQGWVGLWGPVTAGQSSTIPNPVSSTIKFNQYWANALASSSLQNLAEHELGHALGLADTNIPTNVEYILNTPQTALGNQDFSDYYYLW